MREIWNRLVNDPATAKKFITAVVGALLAAVSVGLLPPTYNDYVTVGITFLTALGVYVVPNKKEIEYDGRD